MQQQHQQHQQYDDSERANGWLVREKRKAEHMAPLLGCSTRHASDVSPEGSNCWRERSALWEQTERGGSVVFM